MKKVRTNLWPKMLLLKRYKRSFVLQFVAQNRYKFSIWLVRNNLYDILHDVLLETRCRMCFNTMVPRHILDGMYIRDFLNRQFPQCWIGRGGPISWPDTLGMYSKCIYYYLQYKWDICKSSTIANSTNGSLHSCRRRKFQTFLTTVAINHKYL